MTRMILCLSLLFVATAARAEMLLTEVSGSIGRIFQYGGPPERILVGPFFSGPYVSIDLLANPPGISGLANRVESGSGFEAFAAAVNGVGLGGYGGYLNHELGFETSPAGPELHELHVPVTHLWNGGSGTSGSSSYSVVSHYTPPNGSNLYGTPYSVSAVELTLTGFEATPNWILWTVGEDDVNVIDGFFYTVDFNFKLYAHVPEPSSSWLLAIATVLCPTLHRQSWSCCRVRFIG